MAMLTPGWVDEGGGDWSRTDADGTRWTVCPVKPGDYALTMRYRDHRLTSHHQDREAAMKHRDDMVRAFTARTLRDYAGRR